MPVIYKYLVTTDNHEDNPLTVPSGGRIVGCRAVPQGLPPSGHVELWVEITSGSYKNSQEVFFVGTGQQYPDGWTHVGVAFDGPLVWHLLARAKS